MPIKSLAKNYSAKNFTAGRRTTSKMAADGCSVFNHIFPIILKTVFIVLQIIDQISVLLIAALGFKWNPLWN